MLERVAANVGVHVLIEDVQAYGVRLSPDLLDTAKWIGRLVEWLETHNIAYTLISRSTVRKWVYDSYPKISIPRVEQEIICRDRRRRDGEYCKPSAKYVNDRIIEAAMRHAWHITKPKPGHSNRYGLTKHAYQALALGCTFLDLKAPGDPADAKAVKHILDAQSAITDKIKDSARAFGRQGGLIGGKVRLTTLTPERRKEIARKAAAARWSK
jgi:hypothetical protein